MEGNQYRIQQLDSILLKLDSKIKSYQTKIKRLSGVLNGTTIISLSAASVATSLAAASISITAIPTSIITICLASTCAISTGLNKIASAKLKKYQTKLKLAEDKHTEISKLISDSLEDNAISKEEFDRIMSKFTEIKSEKIN